MTTKGKKFDMLYVHVAVMLALDDQRFRFIPPFGAITPVGMRSAGRIFGRAYMAGPPAVWSGPVY